MYNLLNSAIALSAALLAAIFLFHKRIRTSAYWHATVTPLASIIGSGFLVSAPLMLLVAGRWALLVMTSIVIVAYVLGASLRFNIQYVESHLENENATWIHRIEFLSHPTLALAYVISVAFYLKLLSAFALRDVGIVDPIFENALTTSILLFIGIVGKLRGLHSLEQLELFSVNTKLSIIFSLIIGQVFFNAELLTNNQWQIIAHSHETIWIAIRKILGMLIIIQGFETSRYLGNKYSANTRIETMRFAQIISGTIYILFIGLAVAIFQDVHHITETAVIDLSRVVAPVLPVLLVIAAVMSQFSAAIADTIGSGGLLEEASHEKLKVRTNYLLITLVAISLTWLTDIYEIITIASKAFAVYYALQVLVSLVMAIQQKDIPKRITKIIFFSFLLLLMIFVVIFGIPAKA